MLSSPLGSRVTSAVWQSVIQVFESRVRPGGRESYMAAPGRTPGVRDLHTNHCGRQVLVQDKRVFRVETFGLPTSSTCIFPDPLKSWPEQVSEKYNGVSPARSRPLTPIPTGYGDGEVACLEFSRKPNSRSTTIATTRRPRQRPLQRPRP